MTINLGQGLENRGVVITGGAGGIGRPVAELFAAVGARVMIVDRNQDAVDEVVAGLTGGPHAGIAADLRDTARHDWLLTETIGRLGSLRALVHLAAVLHRRPTIDEITVEDWDAQLDVNLKAGFFLCRAAGRAMRERGSGGRIITYSSQGWWSGGFGGSIVYSASKGGIVSMTRGLARTFGPDGITVNCVAPGNVRTPLLFEGLKEETLRSMTEATPLGRLAEPSELAGITVFLASDHASFISGATINVSGGFLMY
jgi:NAD(P)-dependent dehydrogenase (short-subunit alcohol dehydrogenase family)